MCERVVPDVLEQFLIKRKDNDAVMSLVCEQIVEKNIVENCFGVCTVCVAVPVFFVCGRLYVGVCIFFSAHVCARSTVFFPLSLYHQRSLIFLCHKGFMKTYS